jgi:BirA family biotin operon repressor/biotin-[acetyl-CoA-carboxylase] ligase
MSTITIGKPLMHLPSVDSTNTFATNLLHKGDVIEGTVILADHQTHGKGQENNQWVSDARKNLLFSVIIKPSFLMAERQFYLSMCISNSLVDYISSIVEPVQVKWPNDILVTGRKVAGILIESTISGRSLNTSVIGIGLNVNQQVFPKGLPNPTSLQIATGNKFDLDDALMELIASLSSNLNSLYNQRYVSIKTAYLNNLWRLNEWEKFSDASGIFDGRIVDVTDSGELMVMHRQGTMKHYGFKDIEFVG